jgi:hypothetical protein
VSGQSLAELGLEPMEPRPAHPAQSDNAPTSAPVLELELIPVKARPGHYAAHADGRCIGKASKQPLFDGARALLAEGVPPEVAITTRHAGSTNVATRSAVGEASRWTNEESDTRGLRLRRWRPHPNTAQGGVREPEDARSDPAGTGPATTRARSWPPPPDPWTATAQRWPAGRPEAPAPA